MAKLMRRTLKFGIFVTFAACLALPALAAGPAGGGLADLEIGGTTIHMSPLSTARLSLRVTGPGDFVYEAEAKGGEGFDFGIFDAAGDVLADGTYHYEITAWGAKPKAATAENLRGLEKSRAVARSQAGTFMIRGGALVDSGLEEAVERPAQKAERQAVTTKSQVFTQDVVIEASLCVGFDCVNGESFGADTIKLKENNLRIFFDDTSNSGSFPANDWRIVANDSSNGGASYLAVEDATAGRYPFRIEAGSPSNSLYVEDGGRIGMGTSTPVVQLHVKDGNTPTLRLEQDGSSGFTAQTWDVAGNETNFFVRDATNGSKLPFRIKPSAPTNSIYIDTDGDVGLGTTSPGASLHVVQGGGTASGLNAATGIVVQNTANAADGSIVTIMAGNTGNSQIFFGDTDSELAGRFTYSHANDSMRFFTAESERVRIESDGDVAFNCTDPASDFVIGDGGTCLSGAFSSINAGSTQFTASSSRTLKENLDPVQVDDILEKITGVKVYHYDFIDGPKDRLGLMAEDVHQIFQRGDEKMLNGQDVQMAMWLAIQKLTAKVEELESQLAAQE